jgi:hypothetical protein
MTAKLWVTALAAISIIVLGPAAGSAMAAPCDAPVSNPVACENTLPGNPASQWDVSGAGDASIQGFATDISVNRGSTVQFKVDTPSTAYHLDIYRMGYYNGDGARKLTTVVPLVASQLQPGCFNDATTGLVDCGNWAVSASWSVPADAVSGIYFARLVRDDVPGDLASHIFFIVRDDASTAPVLFQTSDTTWQAYNRYGGSSLYTGGPAGRAYKVSYNRPFTTRDYAPEDFLFNSEFPMVRFLERNGYNVAYSTGLDADRYPARLLQHSSYVSSGHDEYWSNGQRAAVTAARDAGVNLAFFSGNLMLWKTRWEASLDGAATPHRTLVSYKETHANAKIDPLPDVWTGSWRDPRFSPPADGGRPENALTGLMADGNEAPAAALEVPASMRSFRLWRNTSVASLAPGATATLGASTLGYEIDLERDNGFQPAGLVRLSSTPLNVPVLTDHGSTYAADAVTHRLTLYRAPGTGGLVFDAGTVQWSWGLDGTHDRGASVPNGDMQQATVNLLADLGSQPATLQAGLTAATAGSDTAKPTSTITAPTNPAFVPNNTLVTITGSAADTGGGAVAGVEVSVDGGTTWNRAAGTVSWSYAWTPGAGGTYTIKSRAVDDSANLEVPVAGTTVTIGGCPCSLWNTVDVPTHPNEPSDTSAVEVGMKFIPQADGKITRLRFYKGAGNSGEHVGHLWASDGTLLASVPFAGESATGWQDAMLPSPVAVTSGRTYVASYFAPNGNYAWDPNYFNSPYMRGPLRAPSSADSGGNGVYRYGASGFPTSSWLATNYWVDVIFTLNEPDTTRPTVTSVAPAAGATGLSVNSVVAVTFSEAMDGSTLNSSTMQLRDAAGTLVPASVSYDPASHIGTIAPSAPLGSLATYNVTVRGGSGASGVVDVAGNRLAADFTSSFATGAPAPSSCPCSLFGPTDGVTAATDPDADPVEVGVRFRSQTAGQLSALRFYKAPSNTGTHTGHLWSATGTLLATVAFTGETSSGWQEAAIEPPIAIGANTEYVASYHAPGGHYVATSGFFASGYDSGPLHAFGPANGVYHYGSSGTFPDSTFNSTNYWVDVVVETGVDTTPPRVKSVSPADAATDINVLSNVTVTFDERMSAATVNDTTVQLHDASGDLVPATVEYDPAARRATLNPNRALGDESRYTATVKGGAGGVADPSGNAMLASHNWSFTTAAPPTPPPDEGPGGPILVISKSSNAFGRFYGEILRAEGINEFTVKDISTVTAPTLANYDVVVLGEMSVNATQASMFTTWVNGGGNLIAMRPDTSLGSVLGLTSAGAALKNAYVKVDTTKAPGTGVAAQTIQYHGAADRWTLSGATSVATLYSDALTATSNPAVTLRNVGTNGGQAAAFTYDLAKSVVQTRQGNPAWAGQDRDGLSPVRSDDMFFGPASFDPKPDWLDFNKVQIPQADEQQHLLANLIHAVAIDRKPVPRFWFLPDDKKAAVVMTGDDHARGGTSGRFDRYKALSPAGCVVSKWECVRSTSYVYAATPFADGAAAGYQADGFEIALHVNTACGNYTPASLESAIADQLTALQAAQPALSPSVTNRTHCVVWSDWATQPKVELAHGIRLDTTYYYYPGPWVADRPGFMTGSGMPMRYADTDGTMVDVYQAATQMTDESGQSYPGTINALLDGALVNDYWGVFTANIHTDFVGSIESEAIVNAALLRGVPVISARQMLTWLDGRNGSSFGSISYADRALSFHVTQAAGAGGLRGMVPAKNNAGEPVASITRNGTAIPITAPTTIKGVSYVFFDATDGDYVATYADQTAPVISSVATSPTPGAATVTWTTDENSTSKVVYGTSPTSLPLQATVGGLVKSHSVPLSGLTQGATYYYRVTSVDAAGNSRTFTAAPAKPSSFVVPVAKAPATVTVDAGTAVAGAAAAALISADGTTFGVDSTTTGIRSTAFWGSFTLVPRALRSLKVNYTGFNSLSCAQQLAIFRWSDSTWVPIDTRTVGSSSVTISDVVPAAPFSGYVSGTAATGEVRVRVQCTGDATDFRADGDQLQVVYSP